MTMQSRRDLFQAHRLMTQRAALALLRGEPDIPDQPLRRINVATFMGILLAVLAVAGFGIWGLIFKGSPPLKYNPNQATLIIDKQTGTDWVFCGQGNNDICPVLNESSALLALASLAPVTFEPVNQGALTGRRHGPEIGIPGLPQDLPGSGLLVTQPWSVCSQTLNGVGGVGQEVKTTLAGGLPTHGQPLGSNALLVTLSSGSSQDWVIWSGQRWAIDSGLMSKVFNGALPVTVPLVWLDAIRQGPSDFAAPNIPGRGDTVNNGPGGGQAKVGQLYTVTEAGTMRYYVLTEQGLAPISQLQDQLLSFLPGASSQPLSPSNLGHVNGSLPSNGMPATTPAASGASSGVPFCVVYSGPGSRLTMQVETGGQVPQGGTATGAPPNSGQLDSVALPPGQAALVRETGDSVGYFLIVNGRRYALASNQVPVYLGYKTSQAVRLPANVVDLIPSGPGFSPSRARQTASAPLGFPG